MKFREIFRYEIAYQLRRVWTWLFFIAFFAISILITRDNTVAEALHDEFFINSGFAIAKTTIVGCLLWLLVASFVAGEAAGRDASTGMYPLTYTLRISKAQYLGGKFLAALVINALLALAVQLGIVAAVYAPGVDPVLIGPFRPMAYITNYLYLAIPNVLLGTAIQFAVVIRTGRPMTAFLGSMFIFGMAYVVATFFMIQGQRNVTHLLDTIGIHFVLSDLSHMWTTAEKSHRLLTLEGTLLTNRLFWTGFAIATLAITYVSFGFRHHAQTSWLSRLLRTRKRVTTPASVADRTELVFIPHVKRVFGFKVYARQVIAISWVSFRTTAWSFAGIFMLTVIPLLSIPVVVDQLESNGVPIAAYTIQVLEELTAPISNETARWVIIPLLITFFAGSLVWRERDSRLGDITDAHPTPEWTSLLGKFIGLSLMLVLFTITQIASGVLAQIIRGYDHFEFGLYLKILFGLQLPEYLLFAILALVIHTVVFQKYIAHLVVVFVYVVIAFAPVFGLEHNLLIYTASPSWDYTDMRGFGNSLAPWLWFKSYWLAWAILFALVGRLLWMRGNETHLSTRLRIARQRFKPAMLLIFIPIVALGGFIFYNTNILNDYRNSSDEKQQQAEYEKKYKRYENIPQLALTKVSLDITIKPKDHAAEITGVYTLKNITDVTIDSILVGTELAKLDKPVLPGDTISYPVTLVIQPKGFYKGPIVTNGTYLPLHEWLPAFGYQMTRELTNNADRRRYGLSSRSFIPSLYDEEATKRRSPGIVFEAVVSTDEDQTAVGPGKLKRTWTSGGRRHFYYATAKPIGTEWAVASARYIVQQETWNGVAVQIYHYPKHTSNIDRLLKGLKASMEYYSEQFGPYRHDHLTLFERAGNGSGMHADPTMISFTEGFSLWTPTEWGVDLPYAVAGHEMGHQWNAPSAIVEGIPVMSESVAWYYGMKAVEHTNGKEQLKRLLRFMRYPNPYPPIRRGEPLLRGLDPYLSYRRGPFALYAISEYIGEEKVNKALRNVLENHLPDTSRLATTLDLYHELQEATPDSLQYLLHDLFEVNTYWELKLEKANVNGAALDIDVRAKKFVYDTAGVESEVPVNDWIEIGVYGEADKPLYTGKHKIAQERQTINLNLSEPVVRVAIDPNHLLIDLNTDNNSFEIIKPQ